MCLQSLMKFHHCLFKLLRKNQNVADKELQRAITLTELAPSPIYSNTNVHLVDINVYAKLDKIPSLPVQVIKKKTKLAPNPYFSIINVHLANIFAQFYEFRSFPFQDIEKPKSRGQTDGWV